MNEACAAQDRIRPELDRVEKFVVYPPVQHIYPFFAGGRTHIGDVVAADQVAALHQINAHHASQQCVFEVGRVVHAGGQHDDPGICSTRRGRGPQRTQEVAGVVVHGGDRVGPEQIRKHPGHHPAVLHHVAHARRTTQVVFQNPELAVIVTDDVDTRHVNAHAPRRLNPVDLAVEVGRRMHQLAGHNAILEDLTGAIDVGEERFKGKDPLADTRLQPPPLLRRQHPGYEI